VAHGTRLCRIQQSDPELDRTIDKLFYNCLSVNTCDYDRGHESKTGWVDTTLKQWKSSRAVRSRDAIQQPPCLHFPRGGKGLSPTPSRRIESRLRAVEIVCVLSLSPASFYLIIMSHGNHTDKLNERSVWSHFSEGQVIACTAAEREKLVSSERMHALLRV
ncbi:hypothetical protein PO909_001445, partial [Leuciscus waleckii]